MTERFAIFGHPVAHSLSPVLHAANFASLGIEKPPRGESESEPIFGPSAKHERLNCCEKKRRKKVFSHR